MFQTIVVQKWRLVPSIIYWENKKQQLRQYEENTRADALAAALLQRDGHKEAKDKIDNLLEEIDHCIDLLNQ